MGSGADRFGLFQLRVLGLYTPPDAAGGAAGAVATVAPPGKPGPAGLRLRTASRDWFVEARSASHQDVFDVNGTGYDRLDVAQALPAGGVIVSRAARRYATNQTGYFPNPYRVPRRPSARRARAASLRVRRAPRCSRPARR